MRFALPATAAAVALVLTAGPSLAQANPELLNAMALVTAGLADGGEIMFLDARGRIAAKEAGVFTFTTEKGSFDLVFENPEPCVFTSKLVVEGQSYSDMKFDLNLLGPLAVGDNTSISAPGLNSFLVEWSGPGQSMLVGEEWMEAGLGGTAVLSTATRDQLDEAAGLLNELCPKAESP